MKERGGFSGGGEYGPEKKACARSKLSVSVVSGFYLNLLDSQRSIL